MRAFSPRLRLGLDGSWSLTVAHLCLCRRTGSGSIANEAAEAVVRAAFARKAKGCDGGLDPEHLRPALRDQNAGVDDGMDEEAVSYTHLTLPTICSV